MKKIVLTIATIIIAQVSTFSQSVTETRQIKTTALQMYENYKVVMAGLHSNSAYVEDNFMALFESDAVIYNDILPNNNPQQLSPFAYFKKFKANINRIYPAFSDFKMGEPVSVGNRWQIKCYFTRRTKFKTQKDMKYPEWSFNYTMTIEMDKRYDTEKKVFGNAKIVSIDVDNPLKAFFIIENKENIPLLSQSSGEMLQDWDEEYQSRIFPEDKWKLNDFRVPQSINDNNIFEISKGWFSPNITDTHYYQFDFQRFKKNIIGIGVNYSYSPNDLSWGYQKIIVDSDSEPESDSDTICTIKPTNSLSLSVFYGKQIFHKEKSTVFANVGLDFNYVYRQYNDTLSAKRGNSDKINILSGSVPLSVQYLYQLTAQAKKPVFLSFELGIYPELKTNTKLSLICFGGGVFSNTGLWFALNENSLLKFNLSYRYSFNSFDLINPTVGGIDKGTKQGMQNIGIGISWIRTIGK